MKLSDFRIGNWVQRNDSTVLQLELHDFIRIQDLPDHLHPKPIILDQSWLLDFDWPLERKRNKDKDIDGLWIHDGITIYESAWSGDFMYGTYVKGDGEFKGGFSIKYVHQLQNFYHGMSNRELVRKAYYTK